MLSTDSGLYGQHLKGMEEPLSYLDAWVILIGKGIPEVTNLANLCNEPAFRPHEWGTI